MFFEVLNETNQERRVLVNYGLGETNGKQSGERRKRKSGKAKTEREQEIFIRC